MTQVERHVFRPDYAVAPGETLRDRLEEMGLSQVDLAKRSGLSTKHLNQIIRGVAPITQETALILERVTGVHANIWNRLEAAFRETKLRKETTRASADDQEWMRSLPTAALVSRGLITEGLSDHELLDELLRFFGVADREAWRRVWLQPAAAFKKSAAYTSDPYAVATWLRMCDLEARRLPGADFKEAAFRRVLRKIRSLTRSCSTQRAQELCGEAGVALVFVREIGKTRTCGAAWWSRPSRAVIALTDRYKREDAFWFTFFHEAAHLLLHSKKEVFIDEDEKGTKDSLETEANRFAADFLIPPDAAKRLPLVRTKADAVHLADELSISPGILVGRLHHEELWPWNRGNDLIATVEIIES